MPDFLCLTSCLEDVSLRVSVVCFLPLMNSKYSICLFFYCRTFGLFSVIGNYAYSCYEESCTIFLWIYFFLDKCIEVKFLVQKGRYCLFSKVVVLSLTLISNAENSSVTWPHQYWRPVVLAIATVVGVKRYFIEVLVGYLLMINLQKFLIFSGCKSFVLTKCIL